MSEVLMVLEYLLESPSNNLSAFAAVFMTRATMFRWIRPLSQVLLVASPPRTFARSGFKLLPLSEKIEEEHYEWYSPSVFYHVQLGQVFQSRYQAISKLGHGSSATVWLCRDLVGHKYVAMKVCVQDYPSIVREKAAFERLRSLRVSPVVEQCLDSFEISGTNGATHQCFVLEALSLNIAECSTFIFQNKGWDLFLFRRVTREVFEALKYLHTEAKLVHCDIRRENFLMRPVDDAAFRKIEERELQRPSPRKVDGERVVHLTPPPWPSRSFDRAVLCDFGEARSGDTSQPLLDDIQPFPYRAPEVALEVPFSYPADIWNAGVMLWHVLQGKTLFSPYCPSTGHEANYVHLAQMIALMGLPPLSFVQRSASLDFIQKRYFNKDGHWMFDFPIPEHQTLESKESRLEGRDKTEFLRFMRRILHWEPERRATAAELCDDPWLQLP